VDVDAGRVGVEDGEGGRLRAGLPRGRPLPGRRRRRLLASAHGVGYLVVG